MKRRPTSSPSAWSFKPTATRACGVTTRSGAASSNPATWKRLCARPRPPATISYRCSRAATSFRTPSRTAPPSSASAGSARASTRATSNSVTPSARGDCEEGFGYWVLGAGVELLLPAPNTHSLFKEERDAHREADGDDGEADEASSEAVGEARAGVAAGDRRQRHHEHVGPDDRAGRDEVEGGDAVDAEGEQVLERVHPVDVCEAEQAERRQHQDAYSSAEVAAVDAHEELKDERARPPSARSLSGLSRAAALTNARAASFTDARAASFVSARAASLIDARAFSLSTRAAESARERLLHGEQQRGEE